MANYLNDTQLGELDELSSTSIGIHAKEGGFDANHTSRILVIGLGGMGLKTMKRLKGELNERVGKIDDSIVRILSLDTDKKERQDVINSRLLTPEEIPYLDNSEIGAALGAVKDFRPKPIDAVIPDGFQQNLSAEGANQVRLAGRLTVMGLKLFKTICDSISYAISNLRDFSTSTLDVHVVAGIGGGSGSGLIVDVPYIVRAVVRNLGIPEEKLRIFGHVYLPNSYSGIPNMKSAYRNGYAALKEIEYYMNIHRLGETFDALYPDPVGKFSSSKPIFNQCTLIGGKIAGAIVMSNPQEKAITVCIEDLINQCTSVSGSVNKGTGSITDFFTDSSFQVNADNALNVVMADPDNNFPQYANYNYNFIGSTAIKFPTEAIIEQLVGEMCKKANVVLKGNVDNLKQSDVDEFEKGLIRPNDVIDLYARKLENNLQNLLDDADTKWSKSSILTNEHTSPLDNALSTAIVKFVQDTDFVDRAVAEANRKATLIFADEKKGPYFLAKLLTSNSKGGGNVQGFYEKLRNYSNNVVVSRNAYMDSLADFEKQKNDLAQTMQKAFHFKNNLDNFKDILKNIYMLKFKIEVCDNLLQSHYVDMNRGMGVAYSVKNSLDKEFLAYADVYEKISALMIDNARFAANKLGNEAAGDSSSIFSLQDPMFDALKITVMGTVRVQLAKLGESAPNLFAAALASAMINNRAEWATTENCPLGSSKPCNSFRSFIRNYPPFADIVNRNMMDYFEEAYQGKDDAFKANVVQKLIDVIKYNSEPMCNVWETPHFDFLKVQPLCYRYLVLPDGISANSTGWGSKFCSQFNVDNMRQNIYWSPDQNAIYSYTLYARMPIWVHKDLIEYEKEYVHLTMPGVHIDEAPSTKPALKEYPALMIPSQWYRTRTGNIEYSNAQETKMFADVEAEFNYAKAHGIIRQRSTDGIYVVTKIANKLNPVTDKMAIDNFVKNYMEDPENTYEGEILFENHLYPKMMAKYGFDEEAIIGGRAGFMANNDKNAVILLRKQMKLLGKLRAEIEYYKTVFAPAVEEEIRKTRDKERVREFSKFMMFDLVFTERGAWKYRLGDVAYNITSVFEVQDTKGISWQADYMEIAACNAFPNVERYAEHKQLLNDRVRTLQRMIANGDDKAFAALEEKYKVLIARCDSVIGEVETRRLNGNVLKADEIARKEFYTLVRESAEAIMKVFSY